jgi:hypothetical protein
VPHVRSRRPRSALRSPPVRAGDCASREAYATPLHAGAEWTQHGTTSLQFNSGYNHGPGTAITRSASAKIGLRFVMASARPPPKAI